MRLLILVYYFEYNLANMDKQTQKQKMSIYPL